MRLALHQVLGYFLVTSILNYFAYGIGDEGSSHINTHSHQNSLSRLSGNKRQREEGDDIIGSFLRNYNVNHANVPESDNLHSSDLFWLPNNLEPSREFNSLQDNHSRNIRLKPNSPSIPEHTVNHPQSTLGDDNWTNQFLNTDLEQENNLSINYASTIDSTLTNNAGILDEGTERPFNLPANLIPIQEQLSDQDSRLGHESWADQLLNKDLWERNNFLDNHVGEIDSTVNPNMGIHNEVPERPHTLPDLPVPPPAQQIDHGSRLSDEEWADQLLNLDFEVGNQASIMDLTSSNNIAIPNNEMEGQAPFHHHPNPQNGISEKTYYKKVRGKTLYELNVKVLRIKVHSLGDHESIHTLNKVRDYVNYITKQNTIIGHFVSRIENEEMDIFKTLKVFKSGSRPKSIFFFNLEKYSA